MRGQRPDGYVGDGRVRADPTGHLEPVEGPGEPDVHQGQVGPDLLDQRDPLLTVHGHVDLVTRVHEDRAEQPGDIRVVLDDHDQRHLGTLLVRRSRRPVPVLTQPSVAFVALWASAVG